jgi:putative FmdB family regulatory protein
MLIGNYNSADEMKLSVEIPDLRSKQLCGPPPRIALESRKRFNMPIFEYVCDDCGTKFEKLIRNGDTASCPGCGQSRLTTALSTFAAHSSAAGSKKSEMPACPGGMCRTPDLCGRN